MVAAKGRGTENIIASMWKNSQMCYPLTTHRDTILNWIVKKQRSNCQPKILMSDEEKT